MRDLSAAISPRSGHSSRRSLPGLGLAVDITALTGNRNVAFTSPEFTWLCANSETYGWITPRWALPTGMRCGHVNVLELGVGVFTEAGLERTRLSCHPAAASGLQRP